MGEKRWMLIKGSEDGRPISWLDGTLLQSVLDSPADWGISSFVDPLEMPSDTNYWGEGVAALIRYEVIIPVPAGAYRLPDDWDE